jgi:hypothetical protein
LVAAYTGGSAGVEETATPFPWSANDASSGDQQQADIAAVIGLEVQFMPSGETAALFPVPVATVKNIPSCGAQVMSRRKLRVDGVLEVQFMPSVDVMARFAARADATAQKVPISGAQHTASQVLTGAVRAVQVMPSGDVITDEAAGAD